MDDRTALAALCWEARRRGVSYGQLVAQTSREERESIRKKYIRAKAAQKKREEGASSR